MLSTTESIINNEQVILSLTVNLKLFQQKTRFRNIDVAYIAYDV